MIRTIEVNLNAAHPELPLVEATTFVGAPSAVFIRGVPPGCGEWKITAVNVCVSYPDNTTTTRAAVRTADGIWTATIPGTATSGRTANGVRIMADGIDENGDAVTGYILGIADFAVASLAVTPAPEPGATSWQMLYFDTAPGVLRKGDVTKINNVLSIYNGTAWEAFDARAMSAADEAQRTINTHAADSTIHVTATDKAAWNGKQSALSAQQLANIAAVPDKLDTLPHIYRVSGESYGTTYHIFLTKLSNVTLDDVLVCYSDGSGSLTKVVPDRISVSFYDGECFVDLEFAGESQTLAASFYGEPADIGMPFVASLSDIDSASDDLVEQIYDAVKNIAPAFTSKAYALYDLCSYNGVVYRCKSAYTATAQSTKPDADSAHWEAKKVSELFLGNTGSQTLNGGTLLIDYNGPDTTLHLTGLQGDVRIENWGGEYRAVASQQNPDALWYWPGVARPNALARLFDVMRFSEKRGYPEGDIVFYNGGLYRCVIALHSGAWDDSSFELVLGGLSAGHPTAPTPTAGDNSTKVATTAFVQGAVGSIKTFQHDAGGYYIEVEDS